MTNDIYRQVIMDHYKNPQNKISSPLNDSDYIKREALNPSCGDMVTIYVKFINEQIIDIKFQGEGCSICCASASVMTNELNNLSKVVGLEKINQFANIIKDGVVDKEYDFEDGEAFVGVSKFPARFKCAYLSWDTVGKIIRELDE